jgi:aryl-alcohol dehydrogenase-like predicted oxidoreductase
MNLSRIILGCEQLGGKDHGNINFSEVFKVFKKSIKFGINTFDTACIYNLGKSEINLNKIFYKNINKLNIITKGGLNYKFSKTNKKRAIVYKDFSEEFLRNNIKESCDRLKIKCIPLFLIHYPPKDKKTIINVCRYLETFKKENLILNYGFSNINYKCI